MKFTGYLSSILAIMTVATLGICAGGCESPDSDASPTEGQDAASATESVPIPVETLGVSAVDFTETFEVRATAKPVDQVTVSAETGGRILRVSFEEGDEVTAGSRLVEIDTEVDSARINVLENQLDSARREYERTERLADDGLATPQQLDQAETALENARLSLEQAKVGLNKGGIHSPTSGVVSTRHVDAGGFASPGAPIATIIDYDEILLEGQIPERRVRYVRLGDSVEVYLPALDKTVRGELTHRSLHTSPGTGTYTVEVRVDNPDRSILPGMSAQMTLLREQWDQVVMVPREALLQGFQRSEAMVVDSIDEPGPAHLRVVELGPSSGPDVVITDGLEPGELLIVRGHRGLVNSARVDSVRHFESIDQMRSSGTGVDLGQASRDDESE
ncbi:MAG: efflux RND transporter periplasmic adaptor subunit [Persicimonas sp.]